MSKLNISNNKLLEKYYDTVDWEDYSVSEWDDGDFSEYPDRVSEVCQLCSTAIEGGRGKQLEHLFNDHWEVVKDYKVGGKEI